jgi:glycosyltransferase involved in cell wall biosynthesis
MFEGSLLLNDEAQLKDNDYDVVPDFSVIIPALNEEKHIDVCLDSIFAADSERLRIEIIVVDNGSHDRTIDICRQKGVKVYEQPDCNVSSLRNIGANKSNGKILAFMDADCTVAKNWLQAASIYIDKADIVCFGAPPLIPENASWVQKSWFQIRKPEQKDKETDWLETMNMFVRRENFFSVGGFNEKLVTCEDYDISMRLGLLGKIWSDPRIIAVHHGEAATLNGFFRKERWRGKGNLLGVLQHGFSWREMPSIIWPILHIILGFFWILFALLHCIGLPMMDIQSLLLIFVIWQAPPYAFAIYKNQSFTALNKNLRLCILLNAYLIARGTALFK